jgi:hypothetical protein
LISLFVMLPETEKEHWTFYFSRILIMENIQHYIWLDIVCKAINAKS